MNNNFINFAFLEAQRARRASEVPIGAMIVDSSGNVVASAHAELLVIRDACKKLGTLRLVDCDLYVTLEPGPMRTQAISFARIRRLYFGTYDPKGGGVEHGPRIFSQPTCHHVPEVYGGIMEQECSTLLQGFFKARR